MGVGPFGQLSPFYQAELLILSRPTIQAILDYQRTRQEREHEWPSADETWWAMREQIRDAT